MRRHISVVLTIIGIAFAGFCTAQTPAHTPLAPVDAPTSMRLAVRMSNDFAIDLYRRLAHEYVHDNLFFSPYSVVNALTMTAEGARGETAQQMGKVLRFPQEARRAGDDARLLPWDTALIHAGLAELRQLVLSTGSADTAQTQAMRERLQHLEQTHQALVQQFQQLNAQLREPHMLWQGQGQEITERDTAVVQELNALRQQLDPYELHIANALWGEQTFPFRQAFVDTLQRAYDAAAFSTDFFLHAEDARQRINHWVAQQTHERIRELFPEKTIDALTCLVLANAIYFKGSWAEPFDPQQTQEADFRLQDGITTRVQLMAARDKQGHYAELFPNGTQNTVVYNHGAGADTLRPNPHGFQMLELPYRGHRLSMVLLLPKQPHGLPALEQRLTSDNLSKWLATLQERKVHVFLPRYHLETTYKLRPTLTRMGMPTAFRSGGFLGLSDSPEARKLFISVIMHKTFVEVHEEGTEAAAATGVSIRRVSLPLPPPTFRADHPFLFLIRDTQTGIILFVGRLTHPQQTTVTTVSQVKSTKRQGQK